MNEYVQDELPGIDWSQVAKDMVDDDFDVREYNEEDEDEATVAQAFDRGDKGVTADPTPQTAFVVVIGSDGDASAYTSLDSWPDEVQREASLGDIRRGCSELVNEINLQAGARFTLATLTHAVNRPTPADRVREALKRREV